MELKNYWLLLIWLFAAGLFCIVALPEQIEKVGGKQVYRWNWIAVILITLPYVIWAGYRGDHFGDTFNYRRGFVNQGTDWALLPKYLSDANKDKGFIFLRFLFRTILPNDNGVIYFMILAAFQLWACVRIFRKYSDNFWICFFMFVASTDYLSWAHNGIRQFTAVAITTLAFEFIVKKKYIPAILIILLAATIHGSALIMIPCIFLVQGKAWNEKTFMAMLVTVLAIVFMDRFMPFMNTMLEDTQYDGMLTNSVWTTDNGTSIQRVLVYSAPAILGFFGRKYVDEGHDAALNISVNFSCINMFIYMVSAVTSGIYIGRLPIYMTIPGYLCVPYLIDHMFDEKSARLVYIGMIGLFCAFFYVQCHMAWHLI